MIRKWTEMFLTGLLLVAIIPVANAEDLEYCEKAQAAYEAGNHDLEIKYYTRCLDEGDLSAEDLPIVRRGRSIRYRKP